MRLLRTAYGMIAPGGPKGKLQVFIFHRVLDKPDPLLPNEPDIKRFEWMMRLIADNFTVLRLEDAVARLAAGSLPPAAACITFDDGYRDNLELGLPILSRHGLVATFFVATAFLGQGRMWNDDIVEAVRNLGPGRAEWDDFGLGSHPLTTQTERLRCLGGVLPVLKYFPHRERERVARAIARQSGVADSCALMMESYQVQELAATGMEIGAHTHSHPILAQLDTDEAREEIVRGRAELERLTGGAIRVFAYPNGDTRRDLSIRDADLIRQLGFICAMTTDRGVSNPTTNPFLMPRFTPWDRTPMKFAMRSAVILSGYL